MIKRNEINKFYMGAKHIGAAIGNGYNAECTRKTINEAVAEAVAMVESGQVETAIVVRIVKVIRRKKQPVSVETI